MGIVENRRIKKYVPLVMMLVLVEVGFLGWFVFRYPAYCGYVSYDIQHQINFSLSDAEQALLSHGYPVMVDYAPVSQYEWPYLKTSDISSNGDMTSVWLSVEGYSNIHISAHRKISIPPYVVMRDLHELEREQQIIAENNAREVLDIVGLSSTGMFTYREDIDSLDFFLPTTVFYILLLLHFPLTGISIVWFILSRSQRQKPQSSIRPPTVQQLPNDNNESNSQFTR